MSGAARSGRGGRSQRSAQGRQRSLIWLALPTLSLLPLVGLSAVWYLPTRVRLDFTTAQISFTLEEDKSPTGGKKPEILDRSVLFSSLVINHCKMLRFDDGELTAKNVHLTGPVTLTCRGSNPKLALRNPGEIAAPLGLLARIPLPPSQLIVIAAPKGTEPAITLQTETSPELNFSVLVPEVTLDTESCQPEGLPPDVTTYRVKLGEASRILTFTSDSRGLDLTFTTPAGPPAKIFRWPADLPLSSLSLLGAEFEGKVASALRGNATVHYLDHPAVPHVTLEEGSIIDLRKLSEARLKYLSFSNTCSMRSRTSFTSAATAKPIAPMSWMARVASPVR